MDFCTTPTSLSLQDLITAPAKAESLLELLTPDQILAIEQTLGKVKRRRLDNKEGSVTTTASNGNIPTTPIINTNAINTTASTALPTPTTTTTTTAPATKATPLSSNNNVKPNSTTTTTTSTTPNEPVTEVRDGIEWVSFVYSHNRALKRYSIRTDLVQVDIPLIDDKFKSENCVSVRSF
jgi:hypothetical protein